ncbi:MAG: SLC13 family permease [Planctomycetaceae bacterium]
MATLLILAIGLAIVIVGILGLRLHAFVALILAALAVAMLTPSRLLTRSVVVPDAIHDVTISDDGSTVATSEALPTSGPWVLFVDPGPGFELQRAGVIRDAQVNSDSTGHDAPGAGRDDVYSLTVDESRDSQFVSSLRAPGTRLILSSESNISAGSKLAGSSFISRVTSALGDYCGKLAILIVAASIIGRCLLDSGAADRIVRWSLELVGERKAPAAFLFSGFLLGIPVFFDTVFLLMIPLGKALRRRTGKNYLLYVLSIVTGATMAHSLVPPTPGPLFVMEAFGVGFPQMLFGGMLVGLFSASAGLGYAAWINRRCELPLRDDSEPSTTSAAEPNEEVRPSPGLLLSLMPIILPVLLITAEALTDQAVSAQKPWTIAGWNVSAWLLNDPAGIRVREAVGVLGEKNLALLIAACVGVVIYVFTRRPSRVQLSASLQAAVASAGTIILVTAAGGSFGRMMNQTSVAEMLQELPGTSPVMVVVAAFLVTTAVRTAQGSATVAMITSAGIFGSLVAGGAAGVHPLYVALAVGCGSKPVSWMNDSGFWVITKMSGMTEAEGLKYVTPMTALAGLSGLAAIIVAVLARPML